jgi:glucosylceramidase
MKVLNSLIALSNENTLLSSLGIYRSYANYFAKVYEAFEQSGLEIDYFTLQNEPLFGTSKEYPGMYLSSADEAKLASEVAIALRHTHANLLAYDHNWDHPEYPIEVLATTMQLQSTDVFSGVAWHCYAGSMAQAMDEVHSAFPDVPQHITECTGAYPNGICDITQGMTSFGYNHEWDMLNILLGATSHGAVSGVKWIIALDEMCGPVLPDVTFRSGRPFVSIPSTANVSSDIKFNQDYWTMAHMSKFISAGSVRVFSEVEGSAASDIISESFLNEKNGLFTTLVMNLNHDVSINISIHEGLNARIGFTLPPFSTGVFVFDA